jgi:hypothetical protein
MHFVPHSGAHFWVIRYSDRLAGAGAAVLRRAAILHSSKGTIPLAGQADAWVRGSRTIRVRKGVASGAKFAM